jgi:hypothetical protein
VGYLLWEADQRKEYIASVVQRFRPHPLSEVSQFRLSPFVAGKLTACPLPAPGAGARAHCGEQVETLGKPRRLDIVLTLSNTSCRNICIGYESLPHEAQSLVLLFILVVNDHHPSIRSGS